MLWFPSLYVVASFDIISVANALTRDLHIVNRDIAPDGFTRSAVLAEGTIPGPLLSANKGDRFQINVIDELNDTTMDIDTSIHWHGLFQKHTNWADGPAFVTQCPLIPNHSFLYDFSVPGQAGTFWYHSHYSLQYCDGLRGPLVLYDPQDPLQHMYDVDDESTIITIADWYHVPASQADNPDSTLINGLGRTPSDLTAPLAVINVQYGKRYRFRLISISCEPNYVFSIDGHNFTVIEADGVETKPLTVDSLIIYAAQRYSLVLSADQPINNYWVRTQPNKGEGNTTFIDGLNSAILRYVGAKVVDPTTTQTLSVNPLLEVNLHPLLASPVPGGKSIGDVDKALNLIFKFNKTTQEYTVDGVSFNSPNVPVLLQILSGQFNAQDLMPDGAVHALPINSSIEISMPGGATDGPHPIHLHGHNFHVVRSAGSDLYNFDDPVIRDTVNIGSSKDNVTIRFQTDNAGPWFLHCHIDFHLNTGFATVLAEDITQIKSENPVPPSWNDLCPIYYEQG